MSDRVRLQSGAGTNRPCLSGTLALTNDTKEAMIVTMLHLITPTRRGAPHGKTVRTATIIRVGTRSLVGAGLGFQGCLAAVVLVAISLSQVPCHAWLPPLELASPNAEFLGAFGTSVAGVPDLDGDGLSDVVVGASGERSTWGRAYIFSGAGGRRLRTLNRPPVIPPPPNPWPPGAFGLSVAGIGDTNGDSRGDVAVTQATGAPGEEVYLFDGANGQTLHSFSTRSLDGPLGRSLAGLGDVNRDGMGDIVAGAHRSEGGTTGFEGAGRVYVFDGATGHVIRTLDSPNEEEDGFFGLSVSGLSDINGDGLSEIVVGSRDSPGASPHRAGRVYVFDGATGEVLHVLASPNEEEEGAFGVNVSGLEDVDGDGWGDIAVAAYHEGSGAGLENAGRVYLFSGNTGELLRELASPTPENGGGFGARLCALRDVNDDGRGDLAVGTGRGRVYVLDGRTGRVLHWLIGPDEILTGGTSSGFESGFGWSSLAGLGDANGDGRSDLIAGAPGESSSLGVLAAGHAYIFYLGPETITTLVESFYYMVLARKSVTDEVQSWETGYFDYAVAMDVDVRLVPREMGRLFFLSDEYTSRSRTNEQFITDCYWAFLDRDPQQAELDQWLGMGDGGTTPTWNRSEVMTIFAESDEFAARITKMYPDNPGDPSRNFVTTMYIGLLDRLADKEGLEYAASLFDAAKGVGQPPSAVESSEAKGVGQPPSAVEFPRGNPGGGAGATRIRNSIEACRTQAKQTAREILASDEFQSKNPTNGDYTVRLYRAFLGRFPADHEKAYWTGELDAGHTTTDAMIDLFAAAPEFTARLEQYFGG